jgi:hypothetical protein
MQINLKISKTKYNFVPECANIVRLRCKKAVDIHILKMYCGKRLAAITLCGIHAIYITFINKK